MGERVRFAYTYTLSLSDRELRLRKWETTEKIREISERARKSQTWVEMQRENLKPHGVSIPHQRGPAGPGRSTRLGPGVWMALAFRRQMQVEGGERQARSWPWAPWGCGED